MNIRVDLNYPIKDGTEVVFRSPVDCSQITGLKVYYKNNGNTAYKEFAFADAHGNNVGDIDHLFAENVAVKVILDVTTGMAFVQNADTNAYIEKTFVKSVNGATPDENGNVEVAGGGDSTALNEHIANTSNPHGVTCEQIRAVPEDVYAEHQWSLISSVDGANEAINIHLHDYNNPHEVTCEQIGAATKEELQTSVGNIETALDSIVAIQNQLIGGDGV